MLTQVLNTNPIRNFFGILNVLYENNVLINILEGLGGAAPSFLPYFRGYFEIVRQKI